MKDLSSEFSTYFEGADSDTSSMPKNLCEAFGVETPISYGTDSTLKMRPRTSSPSVSRTKTSELEYEEAQKIQRGYYQQLALEKRDKLSHLVGPTGPRGHRGDDGGEGPRGPTGPRGDHGMRGSRGFEGSQGERGERGPEGPPGPTGPAGPPCRCTEDPVHSGRAVIAKRLPHGGEYQVEKDVSRLIITSSESLQLTLPRLDNDHQTDDNIGYSVELVIRSFPMGNVRHRLVSYSGNTINEAGQVFEFDAGHTVDLFSFGRHWYVSTIRY